MRLSSERADADDTDDEGDMFNTECRPYLSGTRLRSEGVGVPDDAREGERRQRSLVAVPGLGCWFTILSHACPRARKYSVQFVIYLHRKLFCHFQITIRTCLVVRTKTCAHVCSVPLSSLSETSATADVPTAKTSCPVLMMAQPPTGRAASLSSIQTSPGFQNGRG